MTIESQNVRPVKYLKITLYSDFAIRKTQEDSDLKQQICIQHPWAWRCAGC